MTIFNPPYIIGVDTGLSTGLATVHGREIVAVWQGPANKVSEQLTTMILDCLNGGGTLDRGLLPLIAAERFINRPQQGGNIRTNQGDAEHILGVIQDVAERHSCRVVLQQPAAAKKLIPNSLLHRFGMHVRAADVNQPDANDVNNAVQHALAAMAVHYASVFDDMLRSVGI